MLVQGHIGGSEEERLAEQSSGNLLTQMDRVACAALQTSYTNCLFAAAGRGRKEDHINTELAALQLQVSIAELLLQIIMKQTLFSMLAANVSLQ